MVGAVIKNLRGLTRRYHCSNFLQATVARNSREQPIPAAPEAGSLPLTPAAQRANFVFQVTDLIDGEPNLEVQAGFLILLKFRAVERKA